LAGEETAAGEILIFTIYMLRETQIPNQNSNRKDEAQEKLLISGQAPHL